MQCKYFENRRCERCDYAEFELGICGYEYENRNYESIEDEEEEFDDD